MKNPLYLPAWYFGTKLPGGHRPLQTVLFITDRCNLSCRHCAESGHGGHFDKPYRQIEEELRWSYARGSRFVDFEGGEPTLWRDGEHTLNDLYDLAHAVGFFSGTLTTNGQQPFGDTKADSVWVSVDGYRDYHDAIRGPGTFEKLDRNIRESGLRSLSVNMAVNRINRPSVADTVRYARDNPAIRSISINFHTPYPGTESLMLPREEKNAVIDEVLELKRRGYPVMNSVSGLKIMKRPDFPKDCWVSNFILADGTRLERCPGSTCGICGECGFCMAGETWAMLRLRPDTILAGLKLRM